MKQIIFKTDNDFEKINHLPFNREYSVRQDLIESMHQFGFIDPIKLIKTDIIDGKEKLWLLDGQNRTLTARFLNMPVYGVIINPKNIKTIEDLVLLVASMNSKSKLWSPINYVEAFNFLNYPDYKELLKITNSSPFTVSTVAILLSNYKSINRFSTFHLGVKDGKFKILDREGAINTLNFAAELSTYEKVTGRMVLALKCVMGLKKFDKEKFRIEYKNNIMNIRKMKYDDYEAVFTSWIK